MQIKKSVGAIAMMQYRAFGVFCMEAKSPEPKNIALVPKSPIITNNSNVTL